MTRQRLWLISNITRGILDLFYKVSKDYPLIKVVDDFEIRMHYLCNENDRLKHELESHPRFSKMNEL